MSNIYRINNIYSIGYCESGKDRIIWMQCQVDQNQGMLRFTAVRLLLCYRGIEKQHKDVGRCSLAPQTHYIFHPSDLHLWGRRFLGE